MPRVASGVLLALLLVPAHSHAQATDTTPPALDAALSSVTPIPLEVSGGTQDLVVELVLSDDLSGVSFAPPGTTLVPGIVLRSPSGAQVRNSSDFLLTEGDALSGRWVARLPFPQWAESGDWFVESLTIADAVGNTATLDAFALEAAGFPTTVPVVSTPDTTAPVLADLTVDPPAIDTSTGPASVTITLHLTDDLAGVDFGARPTTSFTFALGVSEPGGTFARICSEPVLVSGDPLDGTWTTRCDLPRYSQAGDWTFTTLSVWDAAGNLAEIAPVDLADRGLPYGFVLTSTPSDTSRPVLQALSLLPTFIDTSTADRAVAATATVQDDLSGFGGLFLDFTSPSGGQSRTLFMTRTGGTPLAAAATGSVVFPRFSEAGTWRVTQAFVYDAVFNYRRLSNGDLVAAGFPALLNVVLPSLEGDGTVGTGGGTVSDTVFGDRARITLPPGAVDGPTDVAIDVLSSPLVIPMPSGFAAPGTRYVNISFTPTPAMPFPAPGATVVLPLVNPLPAGTVLQLFRVDPASGALVAAVGVSGGPVTGVVDAPGLSATFTGVARFSVVVGLVPDAVPPVVTPPPGLTTAATETGGARAAAAPALAAFLAGGSAIDALDPAPVRLAPQAGGLDVTAETLFPIGMTSVTFRYRDSAGNVGSAAATVTVTPAGPDLTATEVTGVPVEAVLKGRFTVTDTVRNAGGVAATESRTRYYLSADAAWDAGDKALGGGRRVPELAAGASSTGIGKVVVPASARVGTYHLLACADGKLAVAEGNESNNCVASASTIRIMAPDLVVSAVSTPPATVTAGGSFAVELTVANVGDAAASPSAAQWLLSRDARRSGTDLVVGTQTVSALAVGESLTGPGAVTVPAGTPAGTYFLLSCADADRDVAESDEKNNCRASATTVTVP
jgi:hypothetical protein